MFSVSPTDVLHVPEGRLLLQTLRSHDQFNTTIYGLDDRYRGVKGGRRVVFVHPDDIAALGLTDGGHVDLVSEWEDGERRVPEFRVVAYDQPRGCAAAYYPETNPLIAARPRGRGQQLPVVEVGRGAAGPDGAGRHGGPATGASAATRGRATDSTAGTDTKRAPTARAALLMTNPERDPDELVLDPCAAVEGVEVLPPREVPLGGPRAMRVRRTLPQRHRSLIGAWCFVDHYGPDRGRRHRRHVGRAAPAHRAADRELAVHRRDRAPDSAGHHAMVRPGEVNLMTAGRGISHSEVSTPGDRRPPRRPALGRAARRDPRHVDPGFDHHAPEPVTGEGWEARVFLGSLLGLTSPVPTHTPLLGAELLLDAGAPLDLDVDPTFEHGVLVDTGVVTVDGHRGQAGDLAYTAPGRTTLRLVAGAEPARLLLLGGPPFGESIVMWWNFVGRTHEEVVGYREEWQGQITRDGTVVDDSRTVADGRFGVVDHPLPPIPAPTMPHVRLRERR